MKVFWNDAQVMELATSDGIAEQLTAALGRSGSTAVLIGQRLYLAHTQPGDTGLSCLESETQAEFLRLIAAALAPAPVA